jgi:hypothetical protein
MKPFFRHLLMLGVGAFFGVFAQDADTMSKALTTLYEQVAFIDAYKTYCDTAVPDSNATNSQALTTWKSSNNVSQLEQLVVQFSALSPEMAQAFQTTGTAFQTQFAERFAGIEAEACADLPRLLQGEDSSLTALYPDEMQLLPSMAEMVGQPDSGEAANPLAEQTDEPLATTPDSQPLSPPAGAGGLSGLYHYLDTGYTLDAYGGVVPNGYDYWYFFPDGYVYTGGLGHEAVDCASNSEDCDTYTVSGDTITFSDHGSTFSDGEPKAFSQAADTLTIDGNEWSYVKPESFTLEGSYEAVSGGGGFLNISTMSFWNDGRFADGSASGVILSETQDNGDNTETTTSTTDYDDTLDSGSYVIANNSITLTYNDGTVKSYVFDYYESEEDGVFGVYVGGGLYY